MVQCLLFTWHILFISILTSVNITSGGGLQNLSELFHQLELTSIFSQIWKKDICELFCLLRKPSMLTLYIYFFLPWSLAPCFSLPSDSPLLLSWAVCSERPTSPLPSSFTATHTYPHPSFQRTMLRRPDANSHRGCSGFTRIVWFGPHRASAELFMEHVMLWILIIPHQPQQSKRPVYGTQPHVQQLHAFDRHGYRLLTCADWPVLLWWPGIDYPHPLGFLLAAWPRAVTYHHTPCM